MKTTYLPVLRLLFFGMAGMAMCVPPGHAAPVDPTLIVEARKGNYLPVHALLEAGACVTIKSPEVWTALMVAALNGYPAMVTLLLEHKPDVKAVIPADG